MQALFYSQARNNLRSIIDKVCNDFDEVLITTKDDQQAVLISYDEYNSLKETLYLLSSNTNRERLLSAVEEIDKLEFTKKDIAL